MRDSHQSFAANAAIVHRWSAFWLNIWSWKRGDTTIKYIGTEIIDLIAALEEKGHSKPILHFVISIAWISQLVNTDTNNPVM